MGSLEARLARLEGQIDEAQKGAAAVAATLKSLRKNARAGSLADIEKQLEQVRHRCEETAHVAATAADQYRFDLTAFFESGAYAGELKAAADACGLVLVERDGRFSAFPNHLKIDGRNAAVRINQRVERRVRPSVLAGLLLTAQQKTPKFKASDFLNRLATIYRQVAPSYDAHWRESSVGTGPVVPLLDIYDLLTLLPGAARDYPVEEFGRDLLMLDREPELRTPDGLRFSLPASTGSKGRRRLTVFDERGSEHVYVGVRFMRE